MKFSAAKDLIVRSHRMACEQGVYLNFLITGQPGIGKTALGYQASQEIGGEGISISVVAHDLADLAGLPDTYKKGGVTYMRRAITDLFPTEPDRRGVLILDDITTADSDKQNACYQLLLEHRVGSQMLSPQVTIIGTGNREGDGAMVRKSSKALDNRFIHITLDVDVNEWVQHGLRAGYHPAAIGFIRLRGIDALMAFDPKRDEKAQATPRTWEMASNITKLELPPSSRLETLVGTLGKMIGTEYEGYLQIYDEMPSPDVIVLTPGTASVPERPDVVCALVQALAFRASEGSIDAIFQYGGRLPEEYQALLVKDIVTRKPSLQNTTAFVNWAANHVQLFTGGDA